MCRNINPYNLRKLTYNTYQTYIMEKEKMTIIIIINIKYLHLIDIDLKVILTTVLI